MTDKLTCLQGPQWTHKLDNHCKNFNFSFLHKMPSFIEVLRAPSNNCISEKTYSFFVYPPNYQLNKFCGGRHLTPKTHSWMKFIL